MNLEAYNFRPVSSYRSNQSALDVSNVSQWHDINPQHQLLGNLPNELLSNSIANGMRRKKVDGNITPKACYQRGNQMVNQRINVGDQQRMDTASKESQMNPEMQSTQLQNLIQFRTLNVNPLCEESNFLASSPIWKTVAAPGLAPDFYNLSSPYGGFDHLVTMGTASNMGYANDSYFSEVSLTSNQGNAARFVACHGTNMTSPLGMKSISDEVIPSPEQISSITACSDWDLHSDGEPFDTGSNFPSNSLKSVHQSSPERYVTLPNIDQGDLSSIYHGGLLEYNQNFYHVPSPPPLIENRELPHSNACISEPVYGTIPERSNFLSRVVVEKSRSSHEDLLQCELEVLGSQQFDQSPHRVHLKQRAKSLSSEQILDNQRDNVMIEQRKVELPQLPLGRQYKIQQQHPHLFQHVEASKIIDSSKLPLDKVLLEYIKYKSAPQNIGSDQASFLKHLHLTVCKYKKCYCYEYSLLINHHDNCRLSSCALCKPVQALPSAKKVLSEFEKQKIEIVRSLHTRESTSSSTAEDSQPPPKRIRKEDCFLPLNEPFSREQPLSTEGSSHLGTLSEGPLFNKKIAKEMEKEQLSSDKSSIISWETINNNPQDIQRLKFNNGRILSEELNNGCKSCVKNQERAFKVGNNVMKNSQGLDSSIVPVLPEEPNLVQEKEKAQFMSKPDESESEGEENSIETAAGGQLGTNLEDTKITVSLIDCFTDKQIKEHICSLSAFVSQQIMRGEQAKRIERSIGENTCQLCVMDRLVFNPPLIYCSCCGACIKRNLIYYWALDGMGTRHCFCTRCFKESRGSNILFQGLSISKTQLQKERNNEENEESWVQCDKCLSWQHQICALYNDRKDPDGKAKYICPLCRLEEMTIGEHMALPTNFVAKDLPSTTLSDHIEQRLFMRLKKEREERANKVGKSFDEVPGASDLVVRVVLSIDKQLKVKQEFLNIFPHEDYPAEFTYKSKVILLFQKTDGVDVCLFGMYVQEYGSECGHPNQRCIYISYLDSVKYFWPEIEAVTGEALRTFVYQEILIGYLDYCKKRGFATCYIWACPPVKGEDYILYCHPETQKTPKPEKLRQWYKLMLRKAVEDDIVLDYTNLYDKFFIPHEDCSTKVTAARLPYFDGDYWSGAAENMIRNMGKQNGGESEIKVKKLLTKRTLKAMGHNDLSADATKDILLMQKLGQAILPFKEDFIIVHLLLTCMNCHEVITSGCYWFCNQCKNFRLCSRCLNVMQNPNERKTHTTASREEHCLSQIVVNDVAADTVERDKILDSDIFENRHSFLNFCQGNHYQFDTLRRAKHSSMMILYHLHKQEPLTTGTICSICFKKVIVQVGWHCGICPKFCVCYACFLKNGESCHDHKLFQHLPKAECGMNIQAPQQKSCQDVFDLLIHASQCCATQSNPCSYTNCSRMKKIFHHVSHCNIQKAGDCGICKTVWKLLYKHSRTCKASSCQVPRCVDIKKYNAEKLSRAA